MKVTFCKSCLNMSTRPRITFDNRGYCNACQWAEEKQELDWGKREQELRDLLSAHGNKILVPMSGGKDGTHAAHFLKLKYGAEVTGVTVKPPLDRSIGNENLDRFLRRANINHVTVNVPYEVMRQFNREGLIEMGFPYWGWLQAIHTAVLRVAEEKGIYLIMYGEDGEVEDGGSDQTKYTKKVDIEYQKRIYLEGGYEKVLKNIGGDNLYYFTYPKDTTPYYVTHWSYFHDWDAQQHKDIAEKHYGLQSGGRNPGTFTTHAQNDQLLYPLHMYLCYVKFGFGRALQDAGHIIRSFRGKRKDLIKSVQRYDGEYPKEYEREYLDYYQMSRREFYDTIDKWTDRRLFDGKVPNLKPKFKVGEDFEVD